MRTVAETPQRSSLRTSAETPEDFYLRTHLETPPCAWSDFAYVHANFTEEKSAKLRPERGAVLRTSNLWETPQRRNLRIYAHGSNMEFLRIYAEASSLILEILRKYTE